MSEDRAPYDVQRTPAEGMEIAGINAAGNTARPPYFPSRIARVIGFYYDATTRPFDKYVRQADAEQRIAIVVKDGPWERQFETEDAFLAALRAGLGDSKVDGAQLIALERQAHRAREGWTDEHDDEHAMGELALAGAHYAAVAGEQAQGEQGPFAPNPDLWPWDAKWFKPKDQLSNLVRAGALIAAEIDRLLRLQAEDESRGTPT